MQGIYGSAKPGQLHGLMGPSGAGKSTLMDLLAMRTPHDSQAPTAADLAPTAAAPPEASGANGHVAAASALDAATAGDESSIAGGSSSSSRVCRPPPQLLVNGLRMKQQAYMTISAYVPQVSRHILCYQEPVLPGSDFLCNSETQHQTSTCLWHLRPSLFVLWRPL